MSINSLMIINIDSQYNSEYIANVFWNQNLAQVSSITLIPQILGSKFVNNAYIDIKTWCDTEAAYNFIESLKINHAILFHNNEGFWIPQINTHNSGNLFVGSYTTYFNNNFFITKEEEEIIDNDYDWSEDLAEFQREHCIKCFRTNNFITVEEAEEHLLNLNQRIYSERFNDYDINIDDEIEHFKRELRAYYMNQNKNVTLRPHQQSYKDNILHEAQLV